MPRVILTYEDFAALPADGRRLVEGVYQAAGRLEGSEPVALPPFTDLPLDPATIWS